MRKALHEFFRPTREEFEEFWKHALITFDASSLLNLYGYSGETKKQLVEAYNKFKERIILPYQFAFEYSRNRAKVIGKQISNFQKAEKDLEELLKKHGITQEQPFLSQTAMEAIEAIKKELADGRSKMEKSMASDADSDLLLQLFDGKVGPEPNSTELSSFYAEGKARYDEEIPPGFKDIKEKGEPDCYGDFIAWKQMIAIATEKNRDFILVTDDVKEDWWHYEGTRLVGPLPALRKEFHTATGRSVWLYTTEGFLRAAGEFSEIKVGEAALNEVTAASDTQQEERRQRLLKFTHLVKEFTKPDPEIIRKLREIAETSAKLEEMKKKSAPEESDSEDDES